jgi:hypothetical protein
MVSLKAPDICEDPVGFICSRPSPSTKIWTEDEILKMASAADFKKLEPTSHSYFSDYKSRLSSINRTLMKLLAEKGITEKDILDRMSKLRRIAAENFRSGRMGPGDETGPYSNEELAKVVEKVEIITPQRVLFLGEKSGAGAVYIEYCGTNLIETNGVYILGEKTDVDRFAICPGFLLSALNSGSLDAFNFVVPHELTHSVGPVSNPRAGIKANYEAKSYPLFGKYQNFISCIDSNYSDRLQNPKILKEKVLDYQIKSLKLSAVGQNSESMQNIIVPLARGVSKTERLNSVLGREASSAESHAEEMVADLGANLSVVEVLKSSDVNKRPEIISATMNKFCEPEDLTYRIFEILDNGTHPSDKLRIELLLKNPEIRNLLNCPNSNQSKPWCGNNGMKTDTETVPPKGASKLPAAQ